MRSAIPEGPQREGAIPSLPFVFVFGSGGVTLFASLLRRPAKNDREELSGGGGKGRRF